MAFKVDVIANVNGGGVAIKEKNLYVGPLREEKEVTFWEDQLTRLKINYSLIYGEGTIDDGFFKGYLFFTDTN